MLLSQDPFLFVFEHHFDGHGTELTNEKNCAESVGCLKPHEIVTLLFGTHPAYFQNCVSVKTTGIVKIAHIDHF